MINILLLSEANKKKGYGQLMRSIALAIALRKNIETSIIEAASIRFRPILMTSLSTIIGVLPLILGSGPGAASRLTVGITIFGGMLFSTFFTLYVIPTIYSIIGKNTQRIDAVEIELNKQLKK